MSQRKKILYGLFGIIIGLCVGALFRNYRTLEIVSMCNSINSMKQKCEYPIVNSSFHEIHSQPQGCCPSLCFRTHKTKSPTNTTPSSGYRLDQGGLEQTLKLLMRKLPSVVFGWIFTALFLEAAPKRRSRAPLMIAKLLLMRKLPLDSRSSTSSVWALKCPFRTSFNRP